jgi:hypothetical protein
MLQRAGRPFSSQRGRSIGPARDDHVALGAGIARAGRLFSAAAVAAAVAAAPIEDPGNGPRHWDVDDLIMLLLRLYERASGQNRDVIRQRCLDAWDNLLESRAAMAWALTSGLDKAQF